MTLSALIRKREIATATVATPATHEQAKAGTVAKVASVAVANQLMAEEETAIRAWLAHIEETDPATIAEVIDKCRHNNEARDYFLGRTKEVPPAPEPDYTATCGACKHFQRIDHPNLGHCAQGEPEAPAGLWDTDRGWCMKYEVINHG
jgi:hypothetical protein